MALKGEQRKVARTIIRRGRQRGESAKEIKAAIETGLVESGLRNVRGGDRDSSGWRQERASSYPGKNRNDVKAAVDRFYDETSAVEHKYKRAGDLAQAVQRSAFPDRYGQRAKEAQRIIRELDTAKGRRAKGDVTTTTSTKTTPGVDRSGERKQLVAQYLLDKRDNPTTSVVPTALALAEVKDTPAKTTTTTSRTREKPKGGKGGAKIKGTLRESFYNGPGGRNVDEGKDVPTGFVSAHKDHVHAAFDTPAETVRWGKAARRMGLTVREQSRFDPVDPVHTKGSFHYSDRAIDVSGPPAKMAAFSRRLAKAR